MPVSEHRDGFEVVTFAGKVIAYIPCKYDERMRERVMARILRNMRKDCYVRDTRNA